MMTDIRGTRIRLRPGSLPRAREWAAEINRRRKEALTTLRDESVTLELYFLDETENGNYLIGIMRGSNLERAVEIAARSSHPIDAYHQQFKDDTWESRRPLELLVDLESPDASGPPAAKNSTTDREVVERFWAAMAENDFRKAGELLHDEYMLDWPQSGERIRGRDNFAAINEQYPAAGRWQFTVHRIVAGDDAVVSEVSVTDGEITGRAITFSTIRDGKIIHQTEYWPDPFSAPTWRTSWVEPS